MKMKKLLLLFVSLLILLGIIYFLNPRMIFSAIVSSNPRFIILAFVFTNIALFFRVMKWKSLLSNVSFQDAAPVQIFGIAVSNLTPGKIGEPVKSIALKMMKNIPVSVSLPSIIWERIMDLVIMLIFGMIGAYFIIPSSFLFLSEIAMGIFLIVVIALIFLLTNQKFGTMAFSFLRRFPVMNRVSSDFVSSFYKNSISRKGFAKCFAFTFAAWFMDGLTFYAVYLAVSGQLLSISFPVVLTCLLSISILVGLMSSLPGGMGGTEVVMILLLVAIGIASPIAATTVLLGRAITFGYSIVLGYAAFLYLGRKINVSNILKEIGF